MLNFRKLKQDFSPGILKEGKGLYEKGMVVSAKVRHIDSARILISGQVRGNFDNVYESEIDIDRSESKTVDSNCDCTYTYDCQHLAALLFYLEENLNEIVVAFFKETDLEKAEEIDEVEKQKLLNTFQTAATKETLKRDEKVQSEILEEYGGASHLLSQLPFFLPEEAIVEDKAEIALIFFSPPGQIDRKAGIDIQIALRLPLRSKPLHILNIKEFIDAIRYHEPLYLSGKRYFFTSLSFEGESSEILTMLIDHARFLDPNNERLQRVAQLDCEAFGTILGRVYEFALARTATPLDLAASPLPCLYNGSLESPLCYSAQTAQLRFVLEYLEVSAPKILLKPMIITAEEVVLPEEGTLLECAKPGFIYNNVYYRFLPHIKRTHLRHLESIRNMTIPEPLFGSFVENALSELQRYAEVANKHLIEKFVTLPFVGLVRARCEINYLDGELEAILYFIYDKIEVPAAPSAWNYEHVSAFLTPQGVLARNFHEEQKIIQELFEDFIFDAKQGAYIAKTEKKIVEFMTEVIPRNRDLIDFRCPENLLDQFVYDKTHFKLHLKEMKQAGIYEMQLEVDGLLKGVKMDLLWDCITSKRTFLELEAAKKKKEGDRAGKGKILVLNLEKLKPVVQIFDEMGIKKLDNYSESKPLWSLAGIQPSLFEDLPVTFTISQPLIAIQEQMLGLQALSPSPLPKAINASLRNYQLEGVHWLEKLRKMHLNGILADDMGLGKTLQAIVALTQDKLENAKAISLVVCPTSLLYNWKEEFHKFNPDLNVLLIDGTPSFRRKLLSEVDQYDIVITSYTLLQKDIEIYKKVSFSYAILDEAQHIKNRGTRNAKSVKMVNAVHRLILTGTPIENSLEELWSLFDFLMPGLLSSYDRFVEKYIRPVGYSTANHLDNLRKKVAPFILRRMKSDVLQDLPPVSEMVYYCHLSDVQKDLYTSYAASAREELAKLVKKEGFDKVQIHVLATLTRLKQICCHPAIFAKEKPEEADSAKYEMLLELLQGLIEGKHKTVIFSQYTRMLSILRDDLTQRGIRFAYLDGSSKNRLEIVNQFNESENIPIFLVSLKAGGSGLNIVGADTVIHYDMWWNPAVENQATDRVHRLGQRRSVSSYKLITLGTIEEKILQMQQRKKGLVKKVISCDDEAMSKLTWEEVLELLQT